DLADLQEALSNKGTLVIMKIGKRLDAVLDLLEKHNALDGGVFVSHAGMPQEQVEKDLRKLRGSNTQVGYLSMILTKSKVETAE
ncbi:MAG: SAM-dependent methyltransferase, partial [Syntrophaceae bacterium]